MKNVRFVMLLCALLLLGQQAYGQTITISGKIIDSDSQEPVIGATVLVKETGEGTISDIEGNFSLTLLEGQSIKITFIGYKPYTSIISAGTSNLSVLLQSDILGLGEVVVLGTRRRDRTVIESSVPIDVVTAKDIAASGFTQTIEILQYLIPSYNAPKPSISDGTDYVRPATLRGLSPDQVLLLVNGKRRHTSALVHVNGTVGRGAAGADLNAIPASAIERIEVLRDGAAAQYGSDAIAGVINLVLKKGTGFDISASYGANITTQDRGYAPGEGLAPGETDADFDAIADGYYVKDWYKTSEKINITDGGSLNLHLGKGFKIGEEGSIYLSGQVRLQNRSNRAGIDPRHNYFLKNPDGTLSQSQDGTRTVDSREASFDRLNHWYGRSELKDFSFFANGDNKLNNGGSFYFFGDLIIAKAWALVFIADRWTTEPFVLSTPMAFYPRSHPIYWMFLERWVIKQH